jgi:hypothetical protein
MIAVSRKSGVWLRLLAASAASVWVLEAPGCSGTVVSSHGSRGMDAGADGPFGSFGGSGNAPGGRATGGKTTGGGTPPQGALCGNGVIDPGESCDGTNLQGETCYSATMGSSAYGTLSCSGCMFNLSGCYGGSVGIGGQAGAGGSFGFAGSPGTAGAAGMGGMMMGVDPVAVCYANGGVPSPSNPNVCTTGPEATSICQNHYVGSRLSPGEPLGLGTCASGCGCTSCAAQYDSCAMDSDCMTILDCVEHTNCARMVDCYQPSTCQSAIDSVGGQRGRAAIKMSNVLSCMSSVGCSMSCAGTQPPSP